MTTFMEKGKRFIPLCLLSLLLVGGCTQSAAPGGSTSSPSPSPAPSAPLSGTLKVVFFDEQQFMREFGNSFRKKFPHITVQVVSFMPGSGGNMTFLNNEAIMKQKPDVVYGGDLVESLRDSGQILDLSARIKQDKLNLNDFLPGMIENLKELGNGKLIAVSPDFQTNAMYYNKDLFDRLHIPYPTNDMSWANVLELAKKIARTENGKTVYGLTSMTPSYPPAYFLNRYVGGVLINPVIDNHKANYTSAPNMAAVYAAVDAFSSGAYFLPPEKQEPATTFEEGVSRDPFLSGNAGMSWNSPGYMTSLKSAASHGGPSFTWDIVSEPVNPAQPKTSSSVVIGDVFGISKDSPNQELAWAFLKYLIGPEMAADLPQTNNHALSIRNDAPKTIDGHKLDAFYAHQPIQANKSVISKETAQTIASISFSTMTSIIYGHTTVPEGLHDLQVQVQHVLDQDQGHSGGK